MHLLYRMPLCYWARQSLVHSHRCMLLQYIIYGMITPPRQKAVLVLLVSETRTHWLHLFTIGLFYPQVLCSGGRLKSSSDPSSSAYNLCPYDRFGFHNASSIDGLLDKDDVSLEAILDADDLLQECKSQNTRLIDYFQRVDVLQRLLAYVTGQIEDEERGQFKSVPSVSRSCVSFKLLYG